MSDHSFSKEIVPNIQSKPPLTQLEAIAPHPIAGYLGEETNTCLTTTSFQVIVESTKLSTAPLAAKEVAVIAIKSPLSLVSVPPAFPVQVGRLVSNILTFSALLQTSTAEVWAGGEQKKTQPFSWALSVPFSSWLVMTVLCKHLIAYP